RYIDADPQILGRGVRSLPGRKLAARLAERPFTDREDQSGLFGDRDELARRDETSLRMVPSDQSFKARKLACFEHHDRLIEDPEFVTFHCASQVCLVFEKAYGRLAHFERKYFAAIAASMFRMRQSRIGVAKQQLRLVVMSQPWSYANTDCRLNLFAAK